MVTVYEAHCKYSIKLDSLIFSPFLIFPHPSLPTSPSFTSSFFHFLLLLFFLFILYRFQGVQTHSAFLKQQESNVKMHTSNKEYTYKLTGNARTKFYLIMTTETGRLYFFLSFRNHADLSPFQQSCMNPCSKDMLLNLLSNYYICIYFPLYVCLQSSFCPNS